jgi:subtilisin family serine protease
MVKLAFLVVALAVGAFGGPLSSSLESKLRTNGRADVLVSLTSGVKPVLAQIKLQSFATRGAQLEAISKSLRANAASTQRSILSYINKAASDVETKSFWISNTILVKNADAALIKALAERSDVAKVTENFAIHLIEPVSRSEAPISNWANEWGVDRVGAPQVWAAGNRGEGVRVAAIDTGVRHTHTALKGNKAADYNWYDAVAGSRNPVDPQGHGTHVTGTIAGAGGIGVAPGAEWVHCRALDATGGGTLSGLIECAEWIVCPTLPDGSSPNCDKAPHVSSNSWGSSGGNNFLDDILETWIAGRIVPVFANGNDGQYGCGYVGSPADSYHPVIAVGASDIDNDLAYFSSLGPSENGDIKPTITAPGANVRSAGISSDNSFATMSGTSMATPHVAGVAALIISAEPNISYSQLVKKITDGATREISTIGVSCGRVEDTTYPNNHVGHGLISASNSVL